MSKLTVDSASENIYSSSNLKCLCMISRVYGGNHTVKFHGVGLTLKVLKQLLKRRQNQSFIFDSTPKNLQCTLYTFSENY